MTEGSTAMVDVDQELAVAQLKALVNVPGSLKIITAEHVCGIPAVRGEAMPSDPKHQAQCAAFSAKQQDASGKSIDLSHPAHFVQHDVVKIEETPSGRWRAYSDEGDWTEGQPAALLKRLQEWRA